MSRLLKTIAIHSHRGGPNPWKCAIIMEELNVPYRHNFVDFKNVKSEPFLSLNPNGRLPAIEDPNTGITVWESGAICDYLIDQYDTEETLHYTSLREKYQQKAWEHFQVSGQGPYYGQLIWFLNYAPEKVPMAIERYANEVKRVSSVIDAHLKKQGTEYLVGDKVSYVDLMFIPWQLIGVAKATEHVPWPELEAYDAWFERLMTRPAVRQGVESQRRSYG